jgi:hypothetical protein
MAKILISHPLATTTIASLALDSAHPSHNCQDNLSSILEETFYRSSDREEIFYIPNISLKQLPNEQHDPSLEILRQALVILQPDVLIVGNNAVTSEAIAAWRNACDCEQKLLIIRRGVDTRAIDKVAAKTYNVAVDNLPGINSPYVAKHMNKYLKLDEAKPKSKLAVIGVGNIGKNIAIAGVAKDLEVCLFSPSLQDTQKRQLTLLERSIPIEKVICAESIDRALDGADYIAISVPWENNDGTTNADMITENCIRSLGKHSRIVSASVPKIFSEGAIALLDKWVQQEKIFLRIDTSKRRAIELKNKYPDLDAAHDIAFAALECQQALDNAMLQKARDFLHTRDRFLAV